jgi:DNA-binding transcriptional regulator YiaG
MKRFAEQIRVIRNSERLSQSEAASVWGVNLKTLQAWEIGQSEPNPFVAKCVLFYLRWRLKVKR